MFKMTSLFLGKCCFQNDFHQHIPLTVYVGLTVKTKLYFGISLAESGQGLSLSLRFSNRGLSILAWIGQNLVPDSFFSVLFHISCTRFLG